MPTLSHEELFDSSEYQPGPIASEQHLLDSPAREEQDEEMAEEGGDDEECSAGKLEKKNLRQRKQVNYNEDGAVTGKRVAVFSDETVSRLVSAKRARFNQT